MYDIQTRLEKAEGSLGQGQGRRKRQARRPRPQGFASHAAGSTRPAMARPATVRARRAAPARAWRSRLLDAASELFKAHGLNGTSITAIAGASDAFPSQITYYFRTKEALFVEAACRDILHIAERAEKAAARARTPKAYASAVVDSVVGADGLVLFVEALTLARQRPDWSPRSRAPSSGCMSRPRAPMAARWRVTGGTRIMPLTSRPAGSGRSRSASRSRAMPWVGAWSAMGEAMREALGELARSASGPARRRAGAPCRHRAGPSIRKIDMRPP